MSLPLIVTALVGFSLLGAPPKAASPSKPAAVHKTKARPKPATRHHRVQRSAHSKAIPLEHAPGSRAEAYAAMSASTCLAALEQRHIPFSREEPKRGVKIPVRLTGKVGGVLYRTDFPDNQRDDVPWEVYDCRLVLALDDFSEILREHAVAEARIFSAWRPPSKSYAMDDWQRRHPGGLAVDVRELRKDTGAINVSDVPTITVETLNMRNRADAARASSKAGRQKVAKGLYAGIVRYLAPR